MLHKYVVYLTERLIESNFINCSEKENYIYVMELIAEKWVTILTIILISLLSKNLLPTIYFLIFFFCIKRRSGGFHTKHFSTCFLFTISIYINFIFFIMPFMLNHINFMYVLLLLSVITLEVIGSVNHPNMNWNMNEYKVSKHKSRIIVIMESIVIIILLCINADKKIIVSIAFAIILSAVLVFLAKIIKQEI